MKKSFADCSKCTLCDSTGKICETNTPNNLIDIDELYIADISDWSIIKTNIENKNSKLKYLITAPVLCSSTKENINIKIVVDICKDNALKIIEKCKPKKLIIVGELSKRFSDQVSNSKYYEKIDDLLKDSNLEIDEMSNDLLGLKNEITDKPIQKVIENLEVEKKIESKNNMYMFTIPEKYYTDNYRLVDIQNIAHQSRIIYIFRDKNNVKEYYEVPLKQDDFYWYESPSNENKIIEEYQNLQLKIGNYKERCITLKGYGGDNNLTTLHSVDYFLQSKGEAAIINKNIVYFDIEVFSGKNRIFPDPAVSQFPINAISFRTDNESDHTQIYLLKLKDIDPRIDEIVKSGKYSMMNLFTDEYSMILAFLAKLNEINPDFIAGWNSSSFDIPYLVGRMKKLNIPMKSFSPFGNAYADIRGRVICTGFVALDQLDLFKNDTTRPQQPSYKLDSIAETVIGEKKVQYEGNLNQLYSTDIDTFIRYSLTDTDLLKKIEDRVQHIALQDELRTITTTSHSGANSTLGQAEGLFLTSMKKKGLIARNKVHTAEKEDLPGAYVFDARGGLYEGILCDFDFTSLYPSIINTFNIGPDTYIGKISENDAFNLIYNKQNIKEVEIIKDPIHNSSSIKISSNDLNKFIEENQATINISGCIFCGHNKHLSIFNTVISMLFNGRKIYKAKMFEAKQAKDKKLQTSYNGKQMAFKILSNALYGALANEHFKFYNNDLAKSVTLTGQELLKYSTVHIDEYLVKRGKIDEFKVNVNFMNKVTSLTDVIYGDTDSAFLYLTDYLRDKKIEIKKSPEVLKEIENIQTFINEKALSEFLKLHNISKNNSMIHLKNEYIFSKYYTLNGKKHYAAKIISQEGRDVSDIEIKGIEIRRSEIPERSRKMLKEILDIILSDIKKEDIKKQVDKLVETTRKEMFKLIDERNNSIVRTISYSKPLSEYKSMPQHLKAMLIWNDLMSEDFRVGSKGSLWNIKAIDITKAPESIQSNFHNILLKKYKLSEIDAIAVPEDVDQLPKWFIPDEKKIIEYCCNDRVNNLTEPLWKESNQMLLW